MQRAHGSKCPYQRMTAHPCSPFGCLPLSKTVTPYHTHPFEHLNYVIEGHGALVMEGGEEYEIEKGDFALVLPDEKHQYRNKSASESLIVICAVPKEYE